jgi:hypothetical protein
LAAAALAGSAAAAPAQPQALAWIATPDEEGCHTEIELSGRSGQTAQVALVSDGAHVVLRFTKDELPKRAFLAIDVDRKPYSNLLLRLDDPKAGAMTLSDETLNALRKGGTLLIAWLADEPMSASLAGSEQGINDLRVCGAQVSAELAAKEEAEARTQAETRAKQLADEQLAVVRAQKEAAQAQAEQLRRQQAEADAQRQREAAEAQRQADEAQQQRAYDERRQEYLRRMYPQPPAWALPPEDRPSDPYDN